MTELADASPSRVSPKTVEKALKALLKWRDSKSLTQKPQLLEQDEFVYLILTLKKIPAQGRTNPYKIPLPHPLVDPVRDQAELCLIVDDRSKSGLTKDAVNKKIQSENIPVSKVIKLSKLKTNYKPFEAKRKLCDSYDMFLADRRVIPLLPRLLGKQFFKKKKIPVPVDLKHKNWKEQIEKACSSALLFLSTGTCSVVKVGKVAMGPEQILENVMASIDGIAEIVPRKFRNIRSFHLKLLESLALPVYQTVPDLKLKIEVPKEKQEEEKEEGVKSEGKKDSSASNEKRKGKKGRIHEVRYMDSNVSKTLDEDEMGREDEMNVEEGGDGEDEGKVGENGVKRKKQKKGDVSGGEEVKKSKKKTPSEKKGDVSGGEEVEKSKKKTRSEKKGDVSGGEEVEKSKKKTPSEKKGDVSGEEEVKKSKKKTPSEKKGDVSGGEEVKKSKKKTTSEKKGDVSGGEEVKKSNKTPSEKKGYVSGEEEVKKSKKKTSLEKVKSRETKGTGKKNSKSL